MTRRVGILALVALSSVLCLMYSGERVFLWILLLAICAFAYSLFSIHYTLRRMRIHQSVDQVELTGGESTLLKIYISNAGLFPLAHVEFRHDNTQTLLHRDATEEERRKMASTGFIPSVMYRDTKSIHREVSFPYRGVFAPGVISGELSDIFGLFRYKIPQGYLRDRQTITILPKTGSARIEDVEESPAEEGANSRRGELDPYTAVDIRDFMPGDALKRVHWKLTARLGQLQVKEFAEAQAAYAAVFLDLSPHGLQNEEAAALEDRICQRAAAVCREALRSGMPFRVIAYGDERKEVGGGASRELNYYRRFLAGLRFRCAFPFHQIISMEMDAQPAVSLVVAVTSSLTPMLSELLASYTMQGYRVSLIVVPNEAAEEGDGSGGISGIGEAGLQAFAVAQNQADPLNMNPRSEEVSARAS